MSSRVLCESPQFARSCYVNASKAEVIEAFQEWLREKVQVVAVSSDTGRLFWWQGLKRGTRAYLQRTTERLQWRFKHFMEQATDLGLWKFLTLTVRETGYESYKIIQKKWNRLLTRLRQKFPGLRFLRVWEFQKRGSVHIHALLYGIRWLDKAWVAKLWGTLPWVSMPRSRHGVFFYIAKYVVKGFSNVEANAFFWLWRARQWASNVSLVPRTTNSKRAHGIGVSVGLPDGREAGFVASLERNKLYGVLWCLEREGVEVAARMLRKGWADMRDSFELVLCSSGLTDGGGSALQGVV